MTWCLRGGTLAGFSAVCLAAPALAAQQVPTQALTRAEVEFPEPFSQIGGLRELSNGRVLVTDRREMALKRLDFAAGTATALGRTGAGPGEFAFPGGLYPLGGDSTLLYDIGNSRFMVIGPDGRPGETFRPSLDDGDGPMLQSPEGIDAQGRIYFRGPAFRRGPEGPVAADSVPVLRLNRRTRTLDTLGLLAAPKVDIQTSGGRNERSVSIRPVPLSAEDDISVGSDGRVAVARVTPFRVEWWRPDGQVVRGPAIDYRPLRVTASDKQAWANRMMRTGVNMVRENDRTSVSPVSRPPSTEGLSWPETQPPFVRGAARVTPEGEFWLLRTRQADDATPSYDVFDAQGRLARRVTLPRDTEVVGFGRGTVYLVRTDADGLQWLQRYRR